MGSTAGSSSGVCVSARPSAMQAAKATGGSHWRLSISPHHRPSATMASRWSRPAMGWDSPAIRACMAPSPACRWAPAPVWALAAVAAASRAGASR